MKIGETQDNTGSGFTEKDEKFFVSY